MNNLHSTWDNLHSWYYFAHNITQVSQNKIVLPKACLSSISNFVYSPSPTLHFECHFLLHRILSSGLLLDYWIMIPVICNFSHPKQQSSITDYCQCTYSIYIQHIYIVLQITSFIRNIHIPVITSHSEQLLAK